MKKAIRTGLWGALLGVLVIPLLIGTHVHSPAILMTFWPTSILGPSYQGGNPLLTFLLGSIELLGNSLIYGWVGFAIGKLIFLKGGNDERSS